MSDGKRSELSKDLEEGLSGGEAAATAPHPLVVVAAVVSVVAVLLQGLALTARTTLDGVVREVGRAQQVEAEIDTHRAVLAELPTAAGARVELASDLDALARNSGAHILELSFSEPETLSEALMGTEVRVSVTGGGESLARMLSGLVALAPRAEISFARVSPPPDRRGLPLLEAALLMTVVTPGGDGA